MASRTKPNTRPASKSRSNRSTTTRSHPVVGILMGSKSDWPVMSTAAEIFESFGVPYEARVLSAHRTPDEAFQYARTAEERGLEAIVAGAGMAAHLPGVLAAVTPLPVLGVPLEAGGLGGLDALLAIVQMPKGVPVATFAVGRAGAGNAALFAVNLLGATRPALRQRLAAWRAERAAEVLAQDLPAPAMS